MAKKQQADQRVLDLIDLAKKKKEAIAKAEKPNWKTNCSFSKDEFGSNRINLQATTDVAVLVGILAFLITAKGAFEEAAKMLGIEQQFIWMGFSFEDWKSDIETRVTKLEITKEKKNLEMIEERLGKLISPELRQELELQELEKALGK